MKKIFPYIKRIGVYVSAAIVLFCAIILFSLYVAPQFFLVEYTETAQAITVPPTSPPPVFKATHVKTPVPLKAIYMTAWVAGEKSLRDKLVKLISETELNAVVIDIKDASGHVAYLPDDPKLRDLGWSDRRIPDIKEFIQELHDKDIYVIGRIAAFQDPYLVSKFPEWAVRAKSTMAPWKDYKGITWIDAGAVEMWNYLVLLGKDAYAQGFDELNFDYIRFPSDGNMRDIYYPFSSTTPKSEVLGSFFSHLQNEFRGTGAILSGDLFGMTTTNYDDMNIGQVLEVALENFDYVAPMVYPSHYPANFNGYKNPAALPYEVVRFAMDGAYERSSSTPQKIRPWLQDFSLGAVYTAPMVQKQIQAVYDAGFDSWMLWNSANKYTRGALLDEIHKQTASTSSNGGEW